jgi:uncharacterized membrane protein
VNDPGFDAGMDAAVASLGRAAVMVVSCVVVLDWVGWATGATALTRLHSTWPPMTPWTALMLAALAVAILLQSQQPSGRRVRIGRAACAVVGFRGRRVPRGVRDG